MPVKITDSNGISSIHTAERLEINLKGANEIVQLMEIKAYFDIKTELPSGEEVGREYWDSVPLKFTCENNLQLAEAMRVIQQAIGQARYAQMTTPVPEAVGSPGTIPTEEIQSLTIE